MIEIAEKIARALLVSGRQPPPTTELLAAMQAAGLVEIRIGVPGGHAVGFMLKSVAERMVPTGYSMGYDVRDKVAEAVPVPAERKT